MLLFTLALPKGVTKPTGSEQSVEQSLVDIKSCLDKIATVLEENLGGKGGDGAPSLPVPFMSNGFPDADDRYQDMIEPFPLDEWVNESKDGEQEGGKNLAGTSEEAEGEVAPEGEADEMSSLVAANEGL